MIIKRGSGIVECRICGLMFMREPEEDRERHEAGQRLVAGAGFNAKTQRPSAAKPQPKRFLTAKNAKNAEREPEFLTAKYAEYTKRGRELGIL